MQMMADVDLVIVILSDAYLRSPNCMYELLQIWNCRNDDPDRFFKRIRILPLPGTKIFSMRDRLAYATYWKNQRDEIAIVIDENGIDLLGPSELNHLKNTSNIAQNISEVLCQISDILLEPDFEKFCNATIHEFACAKNFENEQTREKPQVLRGSDDLRFEKLPRRDSNPN